MAGKVWRTSDMIRCADCGTLILRRNRTGLCDPCYKLEEVEVGKRDEDSPNVLRDGKWVLNPTTRARDWVAS